MIGPSKIVFQESSSQEEDNNEMQEKVAVASISRQPPANQVYQEQYSNQKSFYELGIPVDAFATLKGHTKGVSCVAVEPKGHRMATGGLDYHVRLWDFHGMNTNLNSFRIIEPFTGNAIRNLAFNSTGSHLMVLNGGKQITMLDRDGARNMLTVKGYMYVKELHQTKGHTNNVYDGSFHPTNWNEFVTASGDGSIRLWDLQQKLEGIQQELAHKILLKCKDGRGLMTGITGVTYTRNGDMVFGGCMDGSLQGFSTKFHHHRPQMIVRDAHRNKEEYTSIIGSDDNIKIITRNTDNTLKVWDTRKFDKPMVHYSNLPNNFPGSKLCFSPDQRYLVAGTSIGYESDQKEAYLHFFDTVNFQKLKTINMGGSSVTGICWSKAINQIVVGTSSGETQIFFDQRLSVRGAIKSLSKQPRVDKDPKFDYSAPVYLPHSLPLYKERPTNNIKKDLLIMRKDPIISAKPHIPVQGPHKGGRDNTVPYTMIQHIIQSLNSNPEKVDDARKPLWQIQKYTSEKAEYTRAYDLTQPQPIFSKDPVEQKQFVFLQSIQKICPHCGLKLCTCIKNKIYQSDGEQEEDKK